MRELIIQETPKAPAQTNSVSSLYRRQVFITYGTVESNNDDGTCNVTMNNGFINRFKIPSTSWNSEDPVYGGITYPPIGAKVDIIFPENDLNSGKIYPSYLNTRNDDVNSNLLGQGDKEIIPGGWIKTYDQEKGIKTSVNGDFSLTVDPDQKLVSLTDFEGNTFKNNGAVWEINGSADFAVAYDDLNTAIGNYGTASDSERTTIIGSINTELGKISASIAAMVTAFAGLGITIPPYVASPITTSPVTPDISGSKVDNVKLA